MKSSIRRPSREMTLRNSFRLTKESRLISLFIASCCGVAFAQAELCDPELVKGNAGPLGYRYRDDRCEGVYARDVSSTTLRVVAVLRSIGSLSSDSSKPLTVEWTPSRLADKSNGVHLRAESLRYRTYYRMDANRPTDGSSFAWPSNIVASLAIQKEELGITATVRADVNGTKRDILLPVKVRQSTEGVPFDGVRLLVVPETELGEVFLTLAKVSDPSPKASDVRNGVPLMYGYYPSGHPIVIPLHGLSAGVYRVQVAATLRDGGSAITELWIENAPG